jgi:hypothetical protein
MAKRRRLAAQPLSTGLAVSAPEAWEVPRERDPVAYSRRGDAGPDGLHDAGSLMAEDDRPLPHPLPVADMEVGMTDAGRGDPDPDLADPRLVESQVLDPQRLTGPRQDGGAHPTIMP